MRCKKCGAKVNKEGKYCPCCGEPIRRQRKWIAVVIPLSILTIAVVFVLTFGGGFNKIFDISVFRNDDERPASDVDDDIESQVESTVEQVYENAGVELPTSYEFKGEVLEVTPIEESTESYTEADVRIELKNRGFDPDNIETNYRSDGTFTVHDCMGNGSETHPLYTLYYISKSDGLWMVCVVNGSVVAMGSGQEEVMTENEYVEVFDGFSKSFIKGIPDGTEMQIKQVNRIDAATLDELDDGRE